jgi:hypothetical protein
VREPVSYEEIAMGSHKLVERIETGAQKNTGGWPVKIWHVTEKIMCAIVQ